MIQFLLLSFRAKRVGYNELEHCHIDVSNELVMLHFLKTLVPLLAYSIEIVHVSYKVERRQLWVAYNSIFRKIFDYRLNEKRNAQASFGESGQETEYH